VDVIRSPALSTAAQKDGEGHETASNLFCEQPYTEQVVGSTYASRQDLPPRVGSPETNSWPQWKAAHSDAEAHETPPRSPSRT
jgi:hypothetical protein